MRKTRVWITMGCCLFVMALVRLGPGQQKARPVGDDQHHDLAAVAHACRDDHAPRRELALRRRPAHHAGLPDPGHDRQIRRSHPAEPQQPVPGQQRHAEARQHDRRLDLHRHDGRQRNRRIFLVRPRSRHRQSALAGSMQMGPNATPIEYTIQSTPSTKAPTAAA